MSSPTARTLKVLREAGWPAQVVERWCQFSRKRKDLFGCIDIVALIKGRIVGIQACAGASHAARKVKALDQPHLQSWLDAGGLFVVWSWAKRGKAGKAKRWTFRIEGVGSEFNEELLVKTA
jgi:hypothetical protein